MHKEIRYKANDSMSELICDNYPMLLVMSRFGIDLGFGDKSVKETCQLSGVNVDTFLAVVNLLICSDKKSLKIAHNKISLLELVKYLQNSHSYFLDYRLPRIRTELVEALSSGDDVSVVIIKYFDEYISEVRRHMMYEENTLFPYIKEVTSGKKSDKYSSDIYSEHHDNVEARLKEFKSIIIKYYPTKTTHELNNVLYDIFSCERDLTSHSYIEDYLLVPTIKFIESK